jgi:transposase
MEEYIGLDVSMKETAVSIRRDGKRIWRGKCASDPAVIANVLRKHAPSAKRVVFETGPLSVWFYHALCAAGLPAICIDARHAKAALDMVANKTDANDADGLAHLAEVGFYREVRVKGFDSMLTRTLVSRERVALMRLRCGGWVAVPRYDGSTGSRPEAGPKHLTENSHGRIYRSRRIDERDGRFHSTGWQAHLAR